MKRKTHTKANGYFKDGCHYSKTGWAWWKTDEAGLKHCTCRPCKAPRELPAPARAAKSDA